jgi:hypothetical protein
MRCNHKGTRRSRCGWSSWSCWCCAISTTTPRGSSCEHILWLYKWHGQLWADQDRALGRDSGLCCLARVFWDALYKFLCTVCTWVNNLQLLLCTEGGWAPLPILSVQQGHRRRGDSQRERCWETKRRGERSRAKTVYIVDDYHYWVWFQPGMAWSIALLGDRPWNYWQKDRYVVHILKKWIFWIVAQEKVRIPPFDASSIHGAIQDVDSMA